METTHQEYDRLRQRERQSLSKSFFGDSLSFRSHSRQTECAVKLKSKTSMFHFSLPHIIYWEILILAATTNKHQYALQLKTSKFLNPSPVIILSIIKAGQSNIYLHTSYFQHLFRGSDRQKSFRLWRHHTRRGRTG